MCIVGPHGKPCAPQYLPLPRPVVSTESCSARHTDAAAAKEQGHDAGKKARVGSSQGTRPRQGQLEVSLTVQEHGSAAGLRTRIHDATLDVQGWQVFAGNAKLAPLLCLRLAG